MPLIKANLTHDEQEAVTAYDRGNKLRGYADDPGWQLLMVLLKEEADRAKAKLESTKSTDIHEIFYLKCRQRAVTELVDSLTATIQSYIEFADNPPSIIANLHF
jgi:hypothetical protein